MQFLTAILVLHALGSLAFAVLTTAMWVVERGERPALDRQRVGWFVREWAAVAIFIPLRVLGLWQSTPRPSSGGTPRDPALPPGPATTAPPVLMVPGYSMNRTCFSFLALYLRRRGWRWVWPVNNGPLSSRVPVQAAALAQRVEQLKAASGADQVDLVAHSMGGLVCSWYLQELGGAAHVRRLVTIGTPWGGSRLAVFGLRREAVDLLPGSDFLAALGDPVVPSTNLWSPDDATVVPSHSSQRDGLPSVRLPLIGHLSMLMSATTFREVARALLPAKALSGQTDSRQTPPAQGDREPALRTADA